MLSKKNIFFLIVVYYGIPWISLADTCKQCMSNNAYCVNRTHYYFCNGDTPLMNGQPSACDNGTFCTNTNDICSAVNNQVKSACDGDCNRCAGQLACVSRTQFTHCIDGQPSSVIASCDTGFVCSAQLFEDQVVKKICAPEEVVQFMNYEVSCPNDEVTTAAPTTSSPPTTIAPPTDASLQKQCEQARQNGKATRFFYTKNTEDSTCNSHIYCETVNGSWETLLLRCKNGSFFDSQANRCTQQKPQDC